MTNKTRNITLDKSIWKHLDVEARKRDFKKVADLIQAWFDEGKL